MLSLASVRTQDRVEGGGFESSLPALVLDQLDVPAVVTDWDGVVQFHNRSAMRRSSDRDMILLRHAEMLRFCDLHADKRFRLFLRQARWSSDQKAELILSGGPGAGRCLARVERLAGQRSCLVLLCASERTNHEPISAGLMRSFGFTTAEERLARYLIAGGRLSDAARDFQRSLHTVRNHLRSIFAKVGVRRQADLIRIFTSL
jgi:DNA-binding CsgD family transcriptional regulator